MKGRSRKLTTAFLLLGLVSLFSDITYEGARSVLGAYFDILGATAVIVGFVTIGDLIGYLMRGVGGFLAGIYKSSKAYWTLVFTGYAVNLFAVPVLAFVGSWEAALALVVLERIGKGLRTPARDVILAEVTEGMGRGKGFGLHEVMDQVGAIVGPLAVAWSLYTSGNDFRGTFIMLAIPALIAIIFLITASSIYPKLKVAEPARPSKGSLGRIFWLYVISMALLSLGYIHWSLVAYHLKFKAIVPDAFIPILYTIAMASDAAVAFPAGYLYDKVGPKTLLIAPLISFSLLPLLLYGEAMQLIASAVMWGIVMGIYETNMRVVVADTVPPHTMAHAYGIYGIIYGFSWTVGNVVMGALYTISSIALLAFSLGAEISAFLLLAMLLRYRLPMQQFQK